MFLVFTSILLGYILQIKILFIHRNNKDMNFVMAYEKHTLFWKFIRKFQKTSQCSMQFSMCCRHVLYRGFNPQHAGAQS